jgi:hypothetical protein
MGSCDFCQAKYGDCAHGNLAGSTSCEEAKERYAKGQEELQKNSLVGLMRQADHRKREMIRFITGGMTRVAGRRYQIKEQDFMAMSLDALQEIWRFIRDAEQEEMMKVNKARREPWRRG